MFEVTTTPITTTKAAAKRRRPELTSEDLAQLLRIDPETRQLFWINRPRGWTKPTLRAGCDLRRNGKVTAHVINVRGQRIREHHLIAFMETGRWPASKRTTKGTRKAAKASTPRAIETAIAASTAAATAPVQVPADLPELSRAVIAAAPKHHRGFLSGLARHFTR